MQKLLRYIVTQICGLKIAVTIQAFKGHAGMTPVPKASAVHRAAVDNGQKAHGLNDLLFSQNPNQS